MKFKLIEECAGRWWKFWSVRIQMLCVLLTGWMWFDPSSLLMAWQMLPMEVRAVLPGHFITSVGAILFLLNFTSIIARNVRQPSTEVKPNGPA